MIIKSENFVIKECAVMEDTWTSNGYKYLYHGLRTTPKLCILIARDSTPTNMNFSYGMILKNDFDCCIYIENFNTQEYQTDAGYIYRNAGNFMRITSTPDGFSQNRVRVNVVLTGACSVNIMAIILA